MKVLRPFLLIASFILIVGLACSINLTDEPAQPAQPEQPAQPSQPEQPAQPVEQPTDAPAPTEVSPTEAPAASSSPFFREEFDIDVLSSWTQFYFKGNDSADESKGSVKIEGGKLVFNLDSKELYSYLIFDGQTYEDVRVEVSAENRGKNNNNVSLICRYSDEGWYEFSIANNGLYWIYAYDLSGIVRKGYNQLANGGSTKIKQGRETNVYAIVCSGEKLTLYINGEETNVFTDRKFKFGEGKVGVNVSSFNVTPIIVEFDYVDILEP